MATLRWPMQQKHYEVLGVPRSATPEEIKKAYRKLSQEWHPDRAPGNKDYETKFRSIRVAYEVLYNPETRRAYDFGFDAKTGTFDPSRVDPTLLDPDKFVETFIGLFSEILDVRVPGFRQRMGNAAKSAAEHIGDEINKSGKKKSKKKKAKDVCKVCKGKGRLSLRQGGFTVFVACSACEQRRRQAS